VIIENLTPYNNNNTNNNTNMFVFGTAGHIDHGKTALIYALTGIDADRLPEEKERGMTIDLGFAWLELPSGEKVGIVDVPGHENLVKNMIVGASGIDAVILVVDAHEGWMPQTEEHFQIIELLNVQFAIIALTKVDLVDQNQLRVVENNIRERLRDTSFHNAPLVRVSTLKNIGIEQLKLEIQKLIPLMKAKRDIKKPRLCVDRVFNIKGTGTVVTGRLTGGALSLNQEVIIFPSYQKARIRSIETYKEKLAEASPGSRVALNLAGVKKEDLKRGDVILGYGPIKASRYIDVKLKLISNLSGFTLKNGLTLDFFWQTKGLPAQIILAKEEGEKPEEERYAQIRLKESLTTFIGDYFILRRATPPLTIGGGIILDPLAEKHNFYDQGYRDFLTERKNLTIDNLIISELKKQKYCLFKEFLVHSYYSFSEISKAVEVLEKKGKLVIIDLWLVEERYWSQQQNRVVELLKVEYQKFPLEKSFPLNQMQPHFKHLPPRLFSALLQSLAKEGKIVFQEGRISIPSYQPAISAQKQEMINNILRLLKDNPTNPPTEKYLSETYPGSQEVVKYLLQEDLIVKLADGILMEKENFQGRKEQIVDYLKVNKSITLEEVRNILGMSRKYMIPFLERLDEEGITIRKENKRFLK
jgi:selenocysteine-specific elongation factor